MDYTKSFLNFLKNTLDEFRPQRQILGDLNIFATEIKQCIGLKSYYSDLIEDPDNGIKKDPLFLAIEYNNAILLASLKPENVIGHLEKSIAENRFYFFLTASEFLLTSKLSARDHNRLIALRDEIREKIGLTPIDFNPDQYNIIVAITDRLLQTAIDDWFAFKTISQKAIKPLIGKEQDQFELLKIENLDNLQNEIINYTVAIGRK